MPFLAPGFHQARVDDVSDDGSYIVVNLDDDLTFERAAVYGLKEWQANAVARILNGERPRTWARRKDEKKAPRPMENDGEAGMNFLCLTTLT
jgi:hypothetical protein